MSKSLHIRFYEELNDFLPEHKKKVSFAHIFQGNPSIKDVIESLGVPHTEIDIILINGKSVNFNHHPNHGDKISVYPAFESFDISEILHLRPEPLRVIRFILDVHLGKLARYLRMLGFDTAYENDFDDEEIIERAVKERRVILTRDKGILRNGKVTHGLWLRSQDTNEQVREVIYRLDLYSQFKPFNRCMNCNGKIFKTEKQHVVDYLKPETRKFFHSFYQCEDCKKIFWKGSHYEKMLKMIDKLKVK